MLKKHFKSFISLSFILIFAVQFSFSSIVFAQSYQHVEDTIGGNTSSSSTNSDSNINFSTYLFIAAGAAVVGFLVYKFFIEKPDVKNETPDSTSNNISLNINKANYNSLNMESEIAKARDKIPFDIYVGLTQDAVTNSQKTFIMGISFKL